MRSKSRKSGPGSRRRRATAATPGGKPPDRKRRPDARRRDTKAAAVRGPAADARPRRAAAERLEQARRLSEALNRLDEALHSTLDADAILELLVREGSAALGCETAAMSAREQGQWRVRHVHGLSAELIGARMSDEQERHAVLALDTRRPVAIEDVLHDERVDREYLRAHGVRAVLVAPLIVQDEPLGVLFFNYHSAPQVFQQVQVDFVSRLATSAAVALQHNRLVAELRRAETELMAARDRTAASLDSMTRLQEIAALFVREDSLQVVFDRIVQAALSIARADLGSLQLLEERSGELRIVAHRGFAPDALETWRRSGGGRAALESGGRVIEEDLARSDRLAAPAAREFQRATGARAIQYTPIVSRSGRPLGVLSTLFRTPQRPDDRTLQLLDLLTGQSADILDRAQAAARLHESEEELRSVFDSSPAAILMLSLEGTILDCNPAALTLHGLSARDEMVGRSCFAFVAPEDLDKTARGWELLLAGGSLTDLEYSALRGDGGRANALLSAALLRDREGAPRSVLAMLRDLTARHESELKYARILATTLSGFWISAEDGRLLEVNDALCRMLGYSREELLTMSIADLEAAESAAEVRGHIARIRERTLDHFVTRHRRRDGTVIDVEISVTWLDVASGRLVVFARDVTERRRMEEALRAAKEAADSANRAKSAFLANMSHEIRTPLNAILGYVQLLQREPPSNPKQGHYLEVISRSGEHLLSLINDVLDVSRAEAGRVALREQPFDFRALLRDLETMFRTRIEERGLRFDVTINGELPARIRGDGAKVRQVLINLVSNSLKFTTTGGIAVRALVRSSEQDLTGGGEVVDSGCGIAPEDQGKVFEAFEQTHQGLQGGGTGLGLTISRQLARLMGGDVTLASRPGQGSVFRFTFRAEPVEPGGLPGDAEAREALRANGLRNLPNGLRERLRSALEGGYTDEVSALVEEVCRHDPEIGRDLRTLADGLHYEDLLALLAD